MRKRHPPTDDRLREALERHRAGDLVAAARLYDSILRESAGQIQTLHLRATIFLQQNQPEQALELIDQAIKRAGERPELLLNRSTALLAMDRPAAAARNAEAVAKSQPQVFGAWFNLGLSHVALERWNTAAEAFARACRLRPGDTRCQLEWRIAELKRSGGKWIELPDEHLDCSPSLAGTLSELIRTLVAQQHLAQASELAAAVGARLSDNPDLALEWLQTLKQCGLPVTATRLGENLIRQFPGHGRTRLFLATELQTRGHAAKACEQYQALLKHQPDYWQAHSNYLIALQLNPEVSPDQVELEHQEWAARHAPAPEFLAAPRSDQPLRIGWFTPRLLAGPMTTFFAAILEAFPREGVEHWLYKCHPASDRTTARFIQAADRFVDASEMDDDSLVARARDDALSVAVDLSGHAPHHRLRSFARRMAPLQVSWLDYFHPTEIPAIDRFISDPVLEFASGNDAESDHLLLPHGRLCFSPPPGSPAPQPELDGPIQLACFNRIAKIGGIVLRCWAEILDRLPDAKLKLRCHQLDRAETRVEFLERAERAGIESERLTLHGWSEHNAVLKAYNRIDVALDTFPFSGCATSADALWMGVPVISLMGATRVGRQTASLLHHSGFRDWIAQDVEDYIERAVSVSCEPRSTTRQRLERREQFSMQSGNCAGFAAELELMLRDAAMDIAATGPHVSKPESSTGPTNP